MAAKYDYKIHDQLQGKHGRLALYAIHAYQSCRGFRAEIVNGIVDDPGFRVSSVKTSRGKPVQADHGPPLLYRGFDF